MKTLILATLMCFTAIAQDKPQSQHYDFTQKLIGVDGKPITITDKGKDGQALTLGEVSVMSLEASLDEDRTATGIDKFKRDQLARKIYGQKDVVLSVEEVTLIKERIGKAAIPPVVGAAWPLLDKSLVEKDKLSK